MPAGWTPLQSPLRDPHRQHRAASRSHPPATAYDLRHAFVVNTDDRDDAVIEPLGRAGARLLEEIVEPGETLGIAMGRTLGSLTEQLRNLARCSVVQLTGALSTDSVGESSIELIRRVSLLNGGTAFPIYAPLYVSSPDVAAELRSQTSGKRSPRAARPPQHRGRRHRLMVAPVLHGLQQHLRVR
jgi:DNA-binding transcriptional regulator LsrR (DeoR family)